MVTILAAMTCLAYGTMRAALVMHHTLLRRIMRATMLFFDTTPKGRLISRFSLDLNAVDYNLPQNLKQFMNVLFRVCEIN